MDINLFLNNTVWGGLKWNLALEKRLTDKRYLEQYGFKVYSQNDEDGIINEIFNRIGVVNKTFIEFGVDRGIECNSHALLLKGWKGLWIEGRKIAYEQILRRFAPPIRRKELYVINDYVTIDNIDHYVSQYSNDLELDLLSIDVDGNDYHIWNAIKSVTPRVVVIEYQGKFTPEIDWIMAYNSDHIWDRSDRSGASLTALEKLGKEKGYQLVGTNICGVNAFFVRKDLCGDLFPLPATAENLYNPVRTNLVGHRNGNPALNYVGQDIEGMEGVFEYYPDWNSLASFGFYKVEVLPNMRRNVMRDYSARLFLKDIPANAEYMYVDVSLGVSVEKIKRKVHVILKIFGHEKEYIISNETQCLKVKIINKETMPCIVALDIETNILYQPSLLGEYSDNRVRGIAIDSVYFK